MGVGKEGVWGWEGRYVGRVRTSLGVVNRWVPGGEAQAMGGGWRRLVGVKGSQGGCSEVENVPPQKKPKTTKPSQRAFTLEHCWWEVKGVLRSDFPAGSSPTLLPCTLRASPLCRSFWLSPRLSRVWDEVVGAAGPGVDGKEAQMRMRGEGPRRGHLAVPAQRQGREVLGSWEERMLHLPRPSVCHVPFFEVEYVPPP